MVDMGNKHKMGKMICQLFEHADKIGLSEEQIAKIKPFHKEIHINQAQFASDLKIAQIELMGIMEVKDFDLATATAAVKKIAEINSAEHLERLKEIKEIRKILTDEQFEKMQILSMPMCDNKSAKQMKKEHKHKHTHQ